MDREKELREAIAAADEALLHLERTERLLRGAGRWGCLDLLGGGILTTLLKHGEMTDARREMEEAKRAVRAFSRELKDVIPILDVNLETGDLLGLADLFMDGFLADALMQARIEQARTKIQQAESQIAAIREDLVRELAA